MDGIWFHNVILTSEKLLVDLNSVTCIYKSPSDENHWPTDQPIQDHHYVAS